MVVNSIFPYIEIFINLFKSGVSVKNGLAGVWVLITHISFIFLSFLLIRKIAQIRKNIKDEIESDFNEILNSKYLMSSFDKYSKTFIIFNEEYKTYDQADKYFIQPVLSNILYIRTWLSIPNMFIGFGILGTFVGLTIGISGFNLESSIEIQESIKNLLNGIGTAFLTSLHGIALSILFSIVEKHQFKMYNDSMKIFCEKMDERYKLTTAEQLQIEEINHNNSVKKWISLLDSKLFKIKDDILDKLNTLLVTENNDGNKLTTANMLRDILAESEKQSNALGSFSTDLADIIIAKFEETSEKTLTPKFKDITELLNRLDERFRSFSSNAGEDIGKGVNNAIQSLQEELKIIVSDFREAFSSGAMQQIDKVVESLTESAIVMENMPNILQKMLSDINEASNSEIDKRQKQTAKEFDAITNKLKESSTHTFNEVKELLNIMDKSKNMLNELLLSMTKSLSEGITISDKLERNTELMIKTTLSFKEISNEFDKSFDKLLTSSQNLDEMSKSFKEDYKKLSENNALTFEKFDESLLMSKDTLKEFADKFEIIRFSLSDIFSEIEKGLKNYTLTTRKGINDNLSEFTNKLTNATRSLSASIELLSDFFDEVSEKRDKRRGN